jgi:hypothetical protein
MTDPLARIWTLPCRDAARYLQIVDCICDTFMQTLYPYRSTTIDALQQLCHMLTGWYNSEMKAYRSVWEASANARDRLVRNIVDLVENAEHPEFVSLLKLARNASDTRTAATLLVTYYEHRLEQFTGDMLHEHCITTIPEPCFCKSKPPMKN